MDHFDEMTCLLYLEGQLERPRTQELAAHAETCAECRALLRALENESHLLSQALAEADEPVPARLLAPGARDATPWAWIISFSLAAASAYTLWTGIIEPWQQQLSEAGFGEGNLLTILFFGGVFWKGWQSMTHTLEIVALATLGIVALGLLRRTWRRWTTIAVVMGALAVALGLASPASAAEIKKAHAYVLPSGEVVKNDLIVAGETARIDGTVEGDLISFGRTLTVNGHVTGDVIGFGQFIQVNGQVDGSVLGFGQFVRINGRAEGNARCFGNIVSLTGQVAKNATFFGASIEFGSKSQVGGGMMVGAGDAALDGRITRDLHGYIGRANLNGFVGGDAEFRSERLTIGPTAEIAGKASYSGPRQPEVSPQAKLASPLEVKIVHRRSAYASPRFYLRQGLRWGGAFLFGLLTLLLMPGFFAEVMNSTRRYGLSLAVGALALLAGLFLCVIGIALLLINVPAAIVAAMFYIPAIYAAQVFVGAWVGEKLLGPSAETGALLGRLAIGLLVIRVLGNLPYLGAWVWLAVILWGLGALALTFYGRGRALPAAA